MNKIYNAIFNIFDSKKFHKRFDGLKWYGDLLTELQTRKKYKLNIKGKTKIIDVWLRLYSCDVNKNKECNKKNCAICNGDNYGCTNTSQYKYAKRTILNFIKKIINKIRGVYKYD